MQSNAKKESKIMKKLTVPNKHIEAIATYLRRSCFFFGFSLESAFVSRAAHGVRAVVASFSFPVSKCFAFF